jgi:hypothetical protein
MVRHKKRAWNMTNPLYRYLHGGKSRKAKHKKRGGTMARHRKGSSHRGFGGGMMTRGLIPVGGLIGAALLGAGAATLSDRAPQMIPYQKYAAGFAVGGLGGVVGVFARDALSGSSGTSSGTVYS